MQKVQLLFEIQHARKYNIMRYTNTLEQYIKETELYYIIKTKIISSK